MHSRGTSPRKQNLVTYVTKSLNANMRLMSPLNALQGPLLQALSSYRYVAHSFAVILSLVAAEQAARAGVLFADTLWFKGGPNLKVLGD
jgi:hypothetical protein